MRALLVLLVLVACGDDPATTRRLVRAVPDYVPVGGGTLVVLEGVGFAPGDRALINSREAPLVHVIDDTRLELVVPPGESHGDIEVVVFGVTGSVSSREVLHYSSAPTITSANPVDVLTTTEALVTLTGTGFAAEGAGEPTVLLNGQPLADVVAVSDTALTFIAPEGIAFSRPSIEIINQRGRGSLARAFRYIPSTSPGLLLFTRFGTSFATFYDPVAKITVPIASQPTADNFRSVWRAADGTYWGLDINSQVGQLDLETQTLIDPVFVPARLPALTRVGTRVLAMARNAGVGGGFGALDVTTGSFTQIGSTTSVCCGSLGITTDGVTVWFTSRSNFAAAPSVNTIDPVSGVAGTPVPLTGPAAIEELRYYAGVLYAATTSSQLVTIDPQTGVVTPVLTGVERISAIEPYVP